MNAIEVGRQPRVGRLWAGKAEPSLEIRLSKPLLHPAANTLLVDSLQHCSLRWARLIAQGSLQGIVNFLTSSPAERQRNKFCKMATPNTVNFCIYLPG
jgi:hypothetical protein